MNNISQQEFLRAAMQRLGMTRDQFCKRISVPRKTFDKWMAPDDTSDKRKMPDIAWSYIKEILNQNSKYSCNTPNGGI